jgi:hypothetical protein
MFPLLSGSIFIFFIMLTASLQNNYFFFAFHR